LRSRVSVIELLLLLFVLLLFVLLLLLCGGNDAVPTSFQSLGLAKLPDVSDVLTRANILLLPLLFLIGPTTANNGGGDPGEDWVLPVMPSLLPSPPPPPPNRSVVTVSTSNAASSHPFAATSAWPNDSGTVDPPSFTATRKPGIAAPTSNVVPEASIARTNPLIP